MDEKKLRHVGYLTAVCAGGSVVIGLVLQFSLRMILANNMEGVHFESLEILGLLKAILVMAFMGAVVGFLAGAFSNPDGAKPAAASGPATEGAPQKPDVDDAARETLAKLGIPSDKPDPSSK